MPPGLPHAYRSRKACGVQYLALQDGIGCIRGQHGWRPNEVRLTWFGKSYAGALPAMSGIVVAHYPVGDCFGEEQAMVSLVEQALALQTEVGPWFSV